MTPEQEARAGRAMLALTLSEGHAGKLPRIHNGGAQQPKNEADGTYDRVIAFLRKNGPATKWQIAAHFRRRKGAVGFWIKSLSDKNRIESTGQRDRYGFTIWRATDV